MAGEYLLGAVGLPVPAAVAPAIEEHLDRLVAATAPWGADRDYLNFAERASTPGPLFGEARAERLAAIAAAYDPPGRLVANHPVRSR